MASNELLQGLVEATLAGSAAILLVLILRRPLRRAFGARAAYALWLLAPLAILATLLPAATVDVGRTQVVQALVLSPVFAAPAAPAQGGLDWNSLLLGLWLFGAAASVAWLWRTQIAFRRGLGHLLPHGDALRAQAANAGLPATLGLWRPQVVLPADFETRFDAVQQALVLAHERRHIARRDAWANAAAALLRCLFWFDPLFHLAAARMRHDQELACDADVLAAHPRQRRHYGDALLNAQLALQTAPLGCHFGFGHPLKERIAMLASSVSTTRRRAGSGVLLCMLLGGGYAAWAAQPAVPVAVPADGIAADIVLRVDEEAPRALRIVSEADKPFLLKTDAGGKHFAIAGTVSRIEHQGQPALALKMDIDEDGKRIAAPSLVVLSGKPAAVQFGSEIQAKDGSKAFKGLRFDVTLTDASASSQTLSVKPAPTKSDTLQQGQALDESRALHPPRYPADALKEGKTGVTVLVVDVDAQGGVIDVKVERSSGDARLDVAAQEAAAKWRFNPAMKQGQPVAGKVRVPVEFAMDEPADAQAGERPARIAATMPPAYPAAAKKQGISGNVVLLVEVDAQGKPTHVAIEQSSPAGVFDAAALDAVRQWRFEPALRQGQPVAGRVRVPLGFGPQGGAGNGLDFYSKPEAPKSTADARGS